MSKLITRASSINRALDQIGDKWCLLLLQEVFWGQSTFSELMAATGASRGVLANRLNWLQSVDCLSRESLGARRVRYHLTAKSLDLYQCALMALQWERRNFENPELDGATLEHLACGAGFTPRLECAACSDDVGPWDVDYAPGPGATNDERDKKVRRRSTVPLEALPGARRHYLNLINVVGDRWTANLIALAFHGVRRFEAFHRELPVATNILSSRLKFLTERGIFRRVPYCETPLRHEYRLTARGENMHPFFLTLLQWGDRWCDDSGNGPPMELRHRACGSRLRARVCCDACRDELRAHEVILHFEGHATWAFR